MSWEGWPWTRQVRVWMCSSMMGMCVEEEWEEQMRQMEDRSSNYCNVEGSGGAIVFVIDA